MPMLTIASPNTDRSLLTIAELRSAAEVSDSSKDATLIPLGNYVAAMIAKACNVAVSGAIQPTLREESVSERFSLKSRQSYLALARKFVVSIDSVTENGTELDTSSYEIENGLLYKTSASRRTHRTHWHHGEVVVAYTAGFATVPDDLKYAAIRFAQIELQRSGRDPLLAFKSISGVSEYRWNATTGDSMVPPEVMSILTDNGYARQFGWLS